jgi:GT2 family glycosyltransferase
MSTPDVTVVIPTHQREEEVVKAVKSALSQEGVGVECLVLDDTREGTARAGLEALNDDRVRYLVRDVPSGGRPAVVRNEGAALARGRYLHFLDDDDMLADGALEFAVGELERNPSRGVAIGWVVPFGDDPYWLDNKRSYFERAAKVARATPSSLWTVVHVLFRGTLFVNSACLIRREYFQPLGGFDPTIPVYEDVDFWMRAIRRYGHVYLDRPVLLYRTGKPSLMHNLGHEVKLVRESNAMIHAKYRRDHGAFEYHLLQACARLLPFELLRHLPFGG